MRMAEYVKKEDIGLTDFEIILCKGDYKAALKMLLDKIENLPTADVIERKKGEWIPVTERLPENIGEEVLVCNSEYGKSNLGFVTVAIYDGSDWLECWQRKTYLADITHWMPLPESPKEEI